MFNNNDFINNKNKGTINQIEKRLDNCLKYNNNIINNYKIEDNNISNNKEFIIEQKNKTINDKEYKYLSLDTFIRKNYVDIINKELLNNKKKVLNYNKNVYVNNYFIKEKKRKKNNSKITRSSKFMGVSKNGVGWQVLIMFKRKKSYIGTYHSEELAARIYDIASIKKKGIKAKTNFIYNNEQITKILKLNIDFK